MSTDISIIIPIYNEEQILEEMASSLALELDAAFGPGYWHFVLVNNGSTDRSAEIIQGIIDRWPPSITVYEKKPNYGVALKVGIAASRGEWVHLVDIEQWDIPFLQWSWAHRAEYDLFIGSKRADPTLNGQHELRRILSWGLNCVLQIFFDFTGTDTHGPKLFHRERLHAVLDCCVMDRGQYDSEIVLRSIRAGLRIVELPIPYIEHRPPRNVILKKVVWNIFALLRMRSILKKIPYSGPVRIRRFNREDMLSHSAASVDAI